MKFSPYSVSKLSSYNQCPKQFEFKCINKVKVPFTMNLALYKGSFIHQVIEEDYNYNTKFKTNEIFTEEYKEKAKLIVKTFEESEIGRKYKEIAELKVHNSIYEEKFGIKIVNGTLEICSYYDKEAWIRGAIDFQYLKDLKSYNIDWKSGKDKSEDETFGIDQSMAYTIYLMLKYPYIDIFISKFVFVEHSTEKEIVYSRDKFKEYVKYFYNKTKKVETDKFYEAKIGPLCSYCDFFTHGICTVPNEKKEETDNFMNSKIEF